MEITGQHDNPPKRRAARWRPQKRSHLGTHLRAQLQPWLDFWTKVNNDWVFNLSGLLAYNFLMSLFPILLVLLAVLGFVLGDQAPDVSMRLQLAVERAVPGGGVIFQAVSNQLAAGAGYLLLFGVLTSAFAGSRLFIVIENCFGVIFQIRGRGFIAQNVMAFSMLALYLVLAVIMVLASVIPAALLPVLDTLFPGSGLHRIAMTLGILVTAVCALLLFGTIYLVVPNRRVRLHEVWPGTLLATALLILYDSLFPLYANALLNTSVYGAVAGFTVVSLIFFYYLAFILLVGAELNAWIAGRRNPAGDIAATLHSMRLRTPESGPTRAPDPSAPVGR